MRPVGACGQVVPRDLLADIIYFTALAASVLDVMATTLRLLQRSEVGEVEEPFREGQVGSSAVPAKRNPVRCERISSLARLLRPLVLVALENLVLWEERDLTNSANERFLTPTALILLDYLIHEARQVVEGLAIREERVRENLEASGEIFSEVLLYKLTSRGVGRVEAHRWLREADAEARRRGTGFLVEVARHPKIAAHLGPEDLKGLKAEELLGASQEIVRGVVVSAKQYLTGSEA